METPAMTSEELGEAELTRTSSRQRVRARPDVREVMVIQWVFAIGIAPISLPTAGKASSAASTPTSIAVDGRRPLLPLMLVRQMPGSAGRAR